MEGNRREQWASSFGFLMAAIGAAIGLGNIWGFPYKMGANGGGAFLLVYLALVALVGCAVMLGELALGRRTGLSTVGAYRKLSKKYTWIGYMGMLSGFVVFAFYCVLGCYVLRFTAGYALALLGFEGFSHAGEGFFVEFIRSPAPVMAYYTVFIVMNAVIVMDGVSGGIEKFSKAALPALAVVLFVLIGYLVCQPGAREGYAFMFTPNFTYLKENFLEVLTTAAGQMFFSLSLGMGCMITYGSYLPRSENLLSGALAIPVFDTLFALFAGMVVMPACSAYGVGFDEGIGLVFVSLQRAFLQGIGGVWGNILGFLFFFLLFMAALTSSISMLEVCTAHILDRRLERRKKAARRPCVFFVSALVFLAGLPVALDGLGVGAFPAPAQILNVSGRVPTILKSWLNLYDGVSEGVLMPLGALFTSVIIGWRVGTRVVRAEVERTPGVRLRAAPYWAFCFKYAVPVVMLVVLAAQIKIFCG